MASPCPVLPLVGSMMVPPGLEQARPLGRLDHRQADAVLHRTARIEHLELREQERLALERAEVARDPGDPDERRVARPGPGSTRRTASARGYRDRPPSYDIAGTKRPGVDAAGPSGREAATPRGRHPARPPSLLTARCRPAATPPDVARGRHSAPVRRPDTPRDSLRLLPRRSNQLEEHHDPRPIEVTAGGASA